MRTEMVLTATDRRLKVAVVTPFFPLRDQPYRGRATYQLLCALREHCEIKVFCTQAGYPAFLQPRKFDYRRSDNDFKVPHLDVQYVEYPAIPGLTRPINGLTCSRAVEPWLREMAPDVVLNYWIFPEGRGALLAAKRLGIPAVVGAIGSDLNDIPDRITGYLTRRTMAEADLVITKSNALRNRALGMGIPGERVQVVGNGCDRVLFAPGSSAAARSELKVPQDDRLVLFVGRLEAAKGIYELLRACLRLKESRQNLRLVFIGDGPEYEKLSGLAREQSSWVLFTKACTPERVVAWLRASDLLALPSYAEGCPNVVLEALSCGRPVVATNVGGIPDLVNEQCGMLIAPREVDALAQALDSVLNQRWDAATIAAQFGRSWQQVADELAAILQKVANSQAVVERHHK